MAARIDEVDEDKALLPSLSALSIESQLAVLYDVSRLPEFRALQRQPKLKETPKAPMEELSEFLSLAVLISMPQSVNSSHDEEKEVLFGTTRLRWNSPSPVVESTLLNE